MTTHTHSDVITSLEDKVDYPFFVGSPLSGTYTLVEGTAVTNFPVTNLSTTSTFDPFKATRVSSGSEFRTVVSIDMTTPQVVSCVALVGHTDADTTARVESSTDGTAWTARFGDSNTTLGKDAAILRFPSVTARYWRVLLVSDTEGVDTVSHITFSDYTVMARPFFSGFTPIILPTQIDLHTNITVGGNYVGSSYSSAGSRISFGLSNLPSGFARDTMRQLLQRWNTGAPVFFAWRPRSNPGDSYYIWRSSRDSVVTPSYSGTLDLMDLSFDGRVFYT